MWSSTSRMLLKGGLLMKTENLDLIFKRATQTTIGLSGKPEVLQAKPFKEIPGFPSLPFIGTAWVFFPIIGRYKKLRMHVYDAEKNKRYGDIVLDKFGKFSIVNLFDPKDIETVFRHEGQYPHRNLLNSLFAYRSMRDYWYKNKGILFQQGEEWYDLRVRLMHVMMKPKATESFVKPAREVAEDMILRIGEMKDQNGEVKDIVPELYKWALESVANLALDTRLGCLGENLSVDSEAMKIIKAVQTFFEDAVELETSFGGISTWKWISTPRWRSFVKSNDYFTETVLKYMNLARERWKTSAGEVASTTLLQQLLSAEDISQDEALTMVIDMFFAGVDTTSHAAVFLLFHFAKNPEKQEKVYKEIMKFLPSPSDKITGECLRQMDYLKCSLKEALRLHPAARVIERTIPCDLVLSGYNVLAGTTVFAMTLACGRSEKYFKNADKFLPERWMEKTDKPHPFAHLPFGFGIRNCIGRRIAEIEVLCIVTEILRKYKVTCHQDSFDFLAKLVNTPDCPLDFTFIKRD